MTPYLQLTPASLVRGGRGHGAGGWWRSVAVCCSSLIWCSLLTAAPKPTLTSVAQVYHLSSQGAQYLPVRVTTTVLFYDPRTAGGQWPWLFVGDQNAAVFVDARTFGACCATTLHAGQRVLLEGVSGAGEPSPIIIGKRITVLGDSPLPPAPRVAYSGLATGRFDAQWVEVEGVVHSEAFENGNHLLTVAVDDGAVTVTVPDTPLARGTQIPPPWVDAVVRVQGIAVPLVRRLWRGVRLLVPTNDQVHVLRAAPGDAFAGPLRSIQSLSRFVRLSEFPGRVRIRGVVTFAGHTLYVQDATGGIAVTHATGQALTPGDQVEVAGYFAASDYSPSLDDAAVQLLGAGAAPVPTAISPNLAAASQHDAELVQTQGRLLHRARQTESGASVDLQSRGGVFQAVSADPATTRTLLDLPTETQVLLRGICTVQTDSSHNPRSFMLLLRMPGDLVVLNRPSWWTTFRIAVAAGVLLAATLLFLGWISLLRRRVRQQTREILSQQRQNRLILNSAADGLCGLDREGRVRFLNPAGAQLLGCAGEDNAGRLWEDLARPISGAGERYPSGASPAAATLRDGVARRVRQEHFQRANGEPFPVEYDCTPMRDAGGVMQGAVISFRDITERHRIEQMKSEFISIVSHELRTPLTSIKGALGLLVSGKLGALPPKGQRMLEVAASNTDRLVRLISDILDIERIESGKITLTLAPCDTALLMQQAAELMQVMADKAEVRLQVEPLAVPLVADADRLLQVLSNLLSNAIKFSPPHGTVWLRVAQVGWELIFEVRDEGHGIPADKFELIFERFQQVDGSDAREKGGSGLGLPICRSLVRQHGGRIWVESEVGAGSSFFVALPCDVAATPPEAADRIRLGTVLLCDDDASIRTVLHATLEHAGYRALTAASGEDALRLAREHLPDVIVLDLTLPGMSGWQTLQALKDDTTTQRIPVLILSALAPQEGVPPLREIVGWLTKPAEERDLLQHLDAALGVSRPPMLGGQVLLVEDDDDLAGVVATQFEQAGVGILRARTAAEAIELSQRFLPALLVLDVTLAEGDAYEVISSLRLHNQLRTIPVVVYTASNLSPEESSHLKLGPTVFLTKGGVSPEQLQVRVLGLLQKLMSQANTAVG
ncbi:MAG: ATP-binding protein [Terriglobales bacterium]